MNHADSPQGTASTPQGGFFDWLRSLGIQRRSDDRWIGGVASGIAHRANIDPIVVRILFIALTMFAGPGVLIYAAAWLLLPDASGKIHLEEMFQGNTTTPVVVLVTGLAVWVGILIITNLVTARLGVWNVDSWENIGAPGWVPIALTWVFWLSVIVVIGFVVQRIILNHGRQVRDWGSSAQGMANTWSADYAEHHDRVSVGSLQKLFTFALAFIAAGLAALWVHVNEVTAVTSLTVPWGGMLVGAVLAATAVFAVSLVIAGIRGKHGNGIGFFAFLGTLTLVFTTLIPWGASYQVFGNQISPDGASGSVTIFGNTEVDLSSPHTDEARDAYEVVQVFGGATITLPSDRQVIIHYTGVAGTLHTTLDGQHETHGGGFGNQTIHLNETGSAPPLVINVRLLAGTVSVQEVSH